MLVNHVVGDCSRICKHSMSDCDVRDAYYYIVFFFFSSRRRHTRLQGDWSSDVCSSDLPEIIRAVTEFIGSPLEAHAEAIVAASPVTYVSNRSAPLLLLHSSTDPDVPLDRKSVV